MTRREIAKELDKLADELGGLVKKLNDILDQPVDGSLPGEPWNHLRGDNK